MVFWGAEGSAGVGRVRWLRVLEFPCDDKFMYETSILWSDGFGGEIITTLCVWSFGCMGMSWVWGIAARRAMEKISERWVCVFFEQWLCEAMSNNDDYVAQLKFSGSGMGSTCDVRRGVLGFWCPLKCRHRPFPSGPKGDEVRGTDTSVRKRNPTRWNPREAVRVGLSLDNNGCATRGKSS